MNVASPFTLSRFEHEATHLYYLQRHTFRAIEQPKPIYIVGSRGTGKTTLLKSLDWNERLTNESLRDQLNQHELFDRYIGIYLKLPEFRFSALRGWLAKESDSLYAALFAIYLDLVWLEGMAEAISELLVQDVLHVPAEKERLVVSRLQEKYAFLSRPEHFQRVVTLRDTVKAIRHVRERIEHQAMLGAPVANVLSDLRCPTQVGELGKEFAGDLVGLCRARSPQRKRGGEPIFFKICMDEGECLDDFQRQTLNTMVRLARAPVYFVVSFVSHPRDLTSTLEQGLTLQQADRDLILLDDMSQQDFRDLSEGVATVRVRRTTQDKRAVFNARATFGELSINALLSEILSQSVSPRAKQLLADATAMAVQKAVPVVGTRRSKASTAANTQAAPPIFETYLTQKLRLARRNRDEPTWTRRRQDSAELRKRFVAAYLAICREVGAEVRYASADMVLQMSDMCIRDFLHQIDCVFKASRKGIERFVREFTPTRVQSNGLHTASLDKYKSIPRSGVNAPTQTGRLIHGLAQITARLQSTSGDLSHLRSSERGLFNLDTRNVAANPVAQSIVQIIKEAAEAGFLRITKDEEHGIEFRIHTSLAPAYGFSYRGAYYPVRFTWEDAQRLVGAKDDTEVENVAKRVCERIDSATDTENLSLFPTLPYDTHIKSS